MIPYFRAIFNRVHPGKQEKNTFPLSHKAKCFRSNGRYREFEKILYFKAFAKKEPHHDFNTHRIKIIVRLWWRAADSNR